jgi:hypothetical protein
MWKIKGKRERSECCEYENSSWDRLWQTELEKPCKLISVSTLSKMLGN